MELGYAACSKVHVFRGDKDYTVTQVQELLGLAAPKQKSASTQGAFGRFLMPLSECEGTFTSFLEELRPGNYIVGSFDIQTPGQLGIMSAHYAPLELHCQYPLGFWRLHSPTVQLVLCASWVVLVH